MMEPIGIKLWQHVSFNIYLLTSLIKHKYMRKQLMGRHVLKQWHLNNKLIIGGFLFGNGCLYNLRTKTVCIT